MKLISITCDFLPVNIDIKYLFQGKQRYQYLFEYHERRAIKLQRKEKLDTSILKTLEYANRLNVLDLSFGLYLC